MRLAFVAVSINYCERKPLHHSAVIDGMAWLGKLFIMCASNSCFTTFVSRVPLVRECCMLVFRYCAHYCKSAGYRDDHFCIFSLLTF